MPRVYDVVTVNRAGLRRVHEYTTDDSLDPGTVLRLDGRYWLVAEAGEQILARPARARARAVARQPARRGGRDVRPCGRGLDGRIFASVGGTEDEADPDAGHGWMCRLVDAGVLAAAGFSRVRKSELLV